MTGLLGSSEFKLCPFWCAMWHVFMQGLFSNLYFPQSFNRLLLWMELACMTGSHTLLTNRWPANVSALLSSCLGYRSQNPNVTARTCPVLPGSLLFQPLWVGLGFIALCRIQHLVSKRDANLACVSGMLRQWFSKESLGDFSKCAHPFFFLSALPSFPLPTLLLAFSLPPYPWYLSSSYILTWASYLTYSLSLGDLFCFCIFFSPQRKV